MMNGELVAAKMMHMEFRADVMDDHGSGPFNRLRTGARGVRFGGFPDHAVRPSPGRIDIAARSEASGAGPVKMADAVGPEDALACRDGSREPYAVPVGTASPMSDPAVAVPEFDGRSTVREARQACGGAVAGRSAP